MLDYSVIYKYVDKTEYPKADIMLQHISTMDVNELIKIIDTVCYEICKLYGSPFEIDTAKIKSLFIQLQTENCNLDKCLQELDEETLNILKGVAKGFEISLKTRSINE